MSREELAERKRVAEPEELAERKREIVKKKNKRVLYFTIISFIVMSAFYIFIYTKYLRYGCDIYYLRFILPSSIGLVLILVSLIFLCKTWREIKTEDKEFIDSNREKIHDIRRRCLRISILGIIIIIITFAFWILIEWAFSQY